ncbi:MAG TPA: metal-dependent hydrolase [Chitinophagaceae bacterium]|nr:metal-dependent hydrolase [Chitinophagaceae bacterium]
MDTITHIVLGACTGEAIAGKPLGKKALLIGAVVNTLPDCDVLSNLWLDTDDALLAHRGFTHSFSFVFLGAAVIGFLFQRLFKKTGISLRFWFLFFSFELFLHTFIDAFNAYGTGWFEPFSHYRVSFNTIFVADPFYTSWLLIAFIALVILRRLSPSRASWVRFGLGISTLYFMYCVVNKFKTGTDIKDILRKQQIAYNNYFTTPTPLNNWLWYIVASVDSGYYLGYYSVFDSKKQIELHYFSKNDFLLAPYLGKEDVQHLIRFSKGLYTVQRWNGSLVFNDLRFGQIVGWYNPGANFVFHYFLYPKEDNEMVVQRGRFAQWNLTVMRSLIRRIEGN